MLRGQKRTNTRTTILALIQARGASIFFSHTSRGEQTLRNQKIQRLDGTKNMISAPPVCEREQNLGEPKESERET
jgi:hypothetical protein